MEGADKRHVAIKENDLRYIGKESSDLEEYMKLGVPRDAIQTFLKLGELILTINPKKDAAKVGVPESTIYRHQKEIQELKSKGLKFDPRTLQKHVIDAYIQYFS